MPVNSHVYIYEADQALRSSVGKNKDKKALTLIIRKKCVERFHLLEGKTT